MRTPPLPHTLLWLTALTAFSLVSTAIAQTMVPPGSPSGHWTLAGSPYIIVDNITIPPGETLTIDPGVTVWITSNMTVTANGSLIQAVGTPSQRITIAAASSSYYYNKILVQNNTGTNRFKYCDFANAQTAISMGAYGGNQVMPVEIMNCTFSNCVSQAIYGEAKGTAGEHWTTIATLDPVIKNCVFSGISNGCVILSSFNNYYAWIGIGYSNPRIVGNIFQNLTGTAFLMQVGSYAGGGSPVFINNTLVNCWGGVDATDPWDVRVQDNIFVGVTNAVKVSGSVSRTISFNDFYGNATNFTGLPSPYGLIIWTNRNGTPADALYNIFQNPLFVGTSDFHLQPNSACIDAGMPDWAYTDMCFPPSQGTSFPDQGAYGGPDAANWLTVVPKLPVQVSLIQSNSFLWLNWGAIPRSSYQVEYLATNLNATSRTNEWLINRTLTAVDKPVSIAVSPYPTTNNAGFYRVQSLGRTPGD